MKKFLIGLPAALAMIFGAQAFAWDGHGGYGFNGWYGRDFGHGHHHGSHGHFGLYIGAPLIWPSIAYYRPALYPAVTQVVVERQPQVYVQRETVAAAPPASGYWYYCPDSRSYYPYAQTCPSAWLQVVPQTSPREMIQ